MTLTLLQYLTHKEYGCCTIAELMALSRANKTDLEKLKEYARDEMTKKGIEITTQQ